ncbi:Aristolochene synthase [Colletotrichum spinosum]|nr:Aristolochene synthase [Colletotrichum spinosum]
MAASTRDCPPMEDRQKSLVARRGSRHSSISIAHPRSTDLTVCADVNKTPNLALLPVPLILAWPYHGCLSAVSYALSSRCIKDLLEYMSLEEGSSYNEKLVSIITGDAKPSDGSPIENIVGDVWHEMEILDIRLAHDLMEPMFDFWCSQTDSSRLEKKGIAGYLRYRERDVAAQLLLALQRFSQGIYHSKEELESTADIEVLFSRHISVVNDVASWDKECRAEREIDAQGSVVSNIVQVLSDDCGFSPESAKTVLWAMCEEWSKMVDECIAKRIDEGCSDFLRKYLDGLKMQMCGNELWSRTTFRYNSSGL